MRALAALVLLLLVPAASAMPPLQETAHANGTGVAASLLAEDYPALSSYYPACAVASTTPLSPRLAWLAGGAVVVSTNEVTAVVTPGGAPRALLPAHVAYAVSPDGKWLVVPFSLAPLLQMSGGDPGLLDRRGVNVSSFASTRYDPAAWKGCAVYAATAINLETGEQHPLGYTAARLLAGFDHGVALHTDGSPSVLVYEWGNWTAPARKVPLDDPRPVLRDGDPPLLTTCELALHPRNPSVPPCSRPDLRALAISAMSISPDGRVLAVVPHDKPSLILLDARTGAALDPAAPEISLGFADAIAGVAWAPDGSRLAVLAQVPGRSGGPAAEAHVVALDVVGVVRTLALDDAPFGLTWGPDGSVTLSGLRRGVSLAPNGTEREFYFVSVGSSPAGPALAATDPVTGRRAFLRGHELSIEGAAAKVRTVSLAGLAPLFSVPPPRDMWEPPVRHTVVDPLPPPHGDVIRTPAPGVALAATLLALAGVALRRR